MSGLEVAGVVLGALPLVISALEHYANGINTAKRFWRYKSEVRSLILQVNTERGIFVNTLEQLLVGIVRIEQMSDLLTSPSGTAWYHAGVEIQLKERLRGSYEIYIDNVSGMEQSLRRMMEKLALDPDGKPQFSDLSTFKQEYKRLKFSLNKSEYAEQLNALRSHNQALIRLTKQSLELEPSRASTKARVCPDFSALQDYARNVFETLRSGLQCSCDGHAVKLRLESRSQKAHNEDWLNTSFRIIFSNSTMGTSRQDWKEANIKCMIDKAQAVNLVPCAPTLQPVSTMKRRVRFDQMELQHVVSRSSSSTTLTVTEQRTVLATTTTPGQIHDLCVAIGQLHPPLRKEDACAGYLLDSLKRKHGVYPLDPPVTVTNGSTHSIAMEWSAYTLRQVLARQAGIGRRLMQHDKFKVAVDLASSVLQLYKTPWLEDNWNKDDVYFVQRPGAPPATIYEHPFIYRKLSLPAASQCSATQPQPIRSVIRNQTLFTLGILLIELLYGRPIEELQISHDLDCQGTPGANWCTAERLIQEEIEYEAGPLYLDAVRRCIRCDFNRKESSLDNHDFQQAVFDGVVVPLERTLQRFNGHE